MPSPNEKRAAPETTGMTLQVYVPPEHVPAARSYYAELFGRPPDFEPHDDFFEWAPIAGQESWFQVAGRQAAAASPNRVRFRVADLKSAVAFLDDRGIDHAPPSQLPGVVAFMDFYDPWGNRLGFYQDLSASGQQPTYPGTSVTDASSFSAFPGR